jgi:hypothetical protein
VGIAKQTPLQVNGLVDSALLTAAALPVAKTSLVMQQQLHQTLFSLVELNAGQLRVVETQAVASTGSAQVLDALMHLSTDLFIEQCRFNPQHDAATEQLLYNALPQWLSSQPNSSTLQLDLNADGTAYTAKLTSDSLVAALAPIRSRLLKQLAALRQRAPEAELIACPTLAALPGLHDALRSQGSLSIVAVEQSLAVAHKVSDQLTSGEGLSLHRALNIEALDTLGSAVAPDNESAKARESFATATLQADGGDAAQLLKQLRLGSQPLNSQGSGAVRVELDDGERLVIRAADSSELTIELTANKAIEPQRGSDGQE